QPVQEATVERLVGELVREMVGVARRDAIVGAPHQKRVRPRPKPADDLQSERVFDTLALAALPPLGGPARGGEKGWASLSSARRWRRPSHGSTPTRWEGPPLQRRCRSSPGSRSWVRPERRSAPGGWPTVALGAGMA